MATSGEGEGSREGIGEKGSGEESRRLRSSREETGEGSREEPGEGPLKFLSPLPGGIWPSPEFPEPSAQAREEKIGIKALKIAATITTTFEKLT
jgi:hypothetical protein